MRSLVCAALSLSQDPHLLSVGHSPPTGLVRDFSATCDDIIFSSVFSSRRSTTICAGALPCKCGIVIPIVPPWIYAYLQVMGTQRVFNIPSSAFSDGVGSYSTTLQFPQGHQFLATMSDATGFATGGISPQLTVEAQTSQSSSCNTTDPGPEFFFTSDPGLQQCQ